MSGFEDIIRTVGLAIDAAGVAVIVFGTLAATAWFFWILRRASIAESYRRYRQAIGRAILLGLELLVAGDIIRTVAVEPTLINVAVLAGIVVIRTFLSVSLQVELEGHWPWQSRGGQRSEASQHTPAG